MIQQMYQTAYKIKLRFISYLKIQNNLTAVRGHDDIIKFQIMDLSNNV